MAAKDPVALIVLEAMEDLLQAVDGTGDWNFDLSGTGVVQIGEILPKMRDPSVSNGRRVVIGPMQFGTLPQESNLFRDAMTMGVYVYAGAGIVADYPNRAKALLRLTHDITRALAFKALRDQVNTLESGKANNTLIAIRRFDGDISGLKEHDLGGTAFLFSLDYRTPNRGVTGGI